MSAPTSFLGDLARRLAAIFRPRGLPIPFPADWETAGPPDDEHPPVPVSTLVAATQGAFARGWYARARQRPANTGRIGPAITPQYDVVHTTDCPPGSMETILDQWERSIGAGNAAHFLIGKRPQRTDARGRVVDGVAQMVPTTRNANHAGGPGGRHGWWVLPGGALVHPNTCSVGIEIDNAGLLRRVGGRWVHVDSGYAFADADVWADSRGRGWERVTDYQLTELGMLLDALRPTLAPATAGATIRPNGGYVANGVPDAALPAGALEVGHWTLDPERKTDPGPQVTALLANRTRSLPHT